MREGATSLDQRKVTSTGIRILDSTRREDDTIAYHAVAGNLHAVTKYAIGTYNGIVADMRTLQQIVVIADDGSTVTICTAVDDHILADDVVVTHLHIRLLATVVEVLRQSTDNSTLMNFVALTDARAVEDADKRHDDAAIAYLHIVFDIHKGEYLTVVAYFSLGADFGFWTNFACHNFQLSNRFSNALYL